MMKVGEKYRLKNLFKNEKCKIVEVVNKGSVVIGFNNKGGWRNEKLSKKSGYEFFWAVSIEDLEHCGNFLEIE